MVVSESEFETVTSNTVNHNQNHVKIASEPENLKKHSDSREKSFLTQERLKRFLFHFGLSFSLVVYIVLGAFLFLWIEAPIERDIRVSAAKELEKYMGELISKLEELNVYNQTSTQFEQEIEAIFDVYQERLFDMFEHPVKAMLFDEKPTLWTFESALLFTSTTIIPVGFGHITPASPMGRLLVVCYSFVGLPLALFALSNLGHFLYDFLYRIFRRSIRFVGWALIILLIAYPTIAALAISQYGGSPLSITDSIYFCISTMFTIGFGDLLPNIPLGFLLVFIVFGVVLVTMSVEVLGAEMVHQIHFTGRRIGCARQFAGKVAEIANRMSTVRKGLGIGLSAQIRERGNEMRRMSSVGKRRGTIASLSTIKHKQRKSVAFEPEIELDYVDNL